MKLRQIVEAYKNSYKKGDQVITALGNGEIVSIVEPSKTAIEGHIMVHLDADARKKHKIEDRPYKMTSSEIRRHVTEGNNTDDGKRYKLVWSGETLEKNLTSSEARKLCKEYNNDPDFKEDTCEIKSM